jgi:CBS domain-containing protein
MKAKDIMTSEVVTVSPVTLVGEMARLLLKHRVSAVPVVEEGKLVGIVSEGDLLHRHEIGTERALRGEPWWSRLLGSDRSPEEYVMSHARLVRDIMTRDVVTVGPEAPLAEIAAVLDKRRIKRVPVLQGAKLAGIVSRSDLVRALASAAESTQEPRQLSDAEIERRLMAELRRQSWWLADCTLVTVADGVVRFQGMMGSDDPARRRAARIAAEGIPGVREVIDDRIAYQPMAML